MDDDDDDDDDYDDNDDVYVDQSHSGRVYGLENK